METSRPERSRPLNPEVRSSLRSCAWVSSATPHSPGGVRKMLAGLGNKLMSSEATREETAQAIAAVTDEQVDEELAEAERRGARILCIEEPDYPASLKQIHDPPGKGTASTVKVPVVEENVHPCQDSKLRGLVNPKLAGD